MPAQRNRLGRAIKLIQRGQPLPRHEGYDVPGAGSQRCQRELTGLAGKRPGRCCPLCGVNMHTGFLTPTAGHNEPVAARMIGHCVCGSRVQLPWFICSARSRPYEHALLAGNRNGLSIRAKCGATRLACRLRGQRGDQTAVINSPETHCPVVRCRCYHRAIRTESTVANRAFVASQHELGSWRRIDGPEPYRTVTCRGDH